MSWQIKSEYWADALVSRRCSKSSLQEPTSLGKENGCSGGYGVKPKKVTLFDKEEDGDDEDDEEKDEVK